MLSVQIGIIGGSGLDDPDILEGRTERYVDTPYGKVRFLCGSSHLTWGFSCIKTGHTYICCTELKL